MSLLLPFGLLSIVGLYWFVTQIVPERRQNTLLRPGFGHGLLTELNERRHERGLPLLEMDGDLMDVAERKAIHQVMTGQDDEGWDYPEYFQEMFGRSLIMELLLFGSAPALAEQLCRQRDLFDGEWIGCGIGVAGGQSGQMALALIVCREAWEPALDASESRSWLQRVGLRA